MGKRKETILLENALMKMCQEKRIYGCEEVTIGFHNSGFGNEIVDFITMDSKGIIKCYEIKVTIEDLKSKAKKSWYGNYNYLIVSEELYNKILDWDKYLPKNVGLIVGEKLKSVKNAKKLDINKNTEVMLKESIIRSMFWKITKYKNANNLEKQKELQSEIRNLKKEKQDLYKRAIKSEKIIYEYEFFKALNDGIEDINLEKIATEEKEKYRNNKKEKIYE